MALDESGNERVFFKILYPLNKSSILVSISFYSIILSVFLYIFINLFFINSWKAFFIFMFIYVIGQKIYFLLLSISEKEITISNKYFKINSKKNTIKIKLEDIYYLVHVPIDSVFGDGRIIKFYQVKNKKLFLFDFSFDNLGSNNVDNLVDVLSDISGRGKEDFLSKSNTDLEKYQVFKLQNELKG